MYERRMILVELAASKQRQRGRRQEQQKAKEVKNVCNSVKLNPALRTPAYNGHFRLSRQKAHTFSLKLTRFIRTPVNTDNGHFFCVLSDKLFIYCQPRFTGTGYLHTVYFHCHNYVIIEDIVPCSNNDRFSLLTGRYELNNLTSLPNSLRGSFFTFRFSRVNKILLLHIVL